MHTLTLKIDETIFDKVLFFLENLPKNKIEILEDKKADQNDFIKQYAEHPRSFGRDENFLSRDESNAR